MLRGGIIGGMVVVGFVGGGRRTRARGSRVKRATRSFLLLGVLLELAGSSEV